MYGIYPSVAGISLVIIFPGFTYVVVCVRTVLKISFAFLLVLLETRWGREILWNWSYRWLWITGWPGVGAGNAVLWKSRECFQLLSVFSRTKQFHNWFVFCCEFVFSLYAELSTDPGFCVCWVRELDPQTSALFLRSDESPLHGRCWDFLHMLALGTRQPHFLEPVSVTR